MSQLKLLEHQANHGAECFSYFPASLRLEVCPLICEMGVCPLRWGYVLYDFPRTCLQRRHKRGKASRKRDVGDSEAWFRDLIWAYYERYKSKQLNNAVNALHVDGDVCKEDLLSQCLPYCRRMVAARVQVVLLPHQKGAHSEDRCLRPARAKRALEEPSDRQPPRLRPRQVPRTSGSHAAYY